MLNPFIGSELPPPIALLLEFVFNCIPPAELGVELCSVAEVGFPLTATGFYYWLLLSICVKMSLVYFNLLVISALLLSRAWFRGIVDLSPFLFT
jgi:hypothetical protein